MERLQALYQETILLLQALQKLEKKELDRDKVIEQIQVHIEKRENILQQITAPYSEEENKIGKEIVNLNKEIKFHMDQLHFEVKKDIKQIQQRKAQNYSYINPYGKMKTSDGIYMDNKL